MNIVREVVFAGRENAIRLELREDAELLMAAYPDLAPTRWVLTMAAPTPITVDSDTAPSAFDWDAVTSVLTLRLGAQLTTALGPALCTLLVYDALFPNGAVLIHPTCTPDKLTIQVCALV